MNKTNEHHISGKVQHADNEIYYGEHTAPLMSNVSFAVEIIFKNQKNNKHTHKKKMIWNYIANSESTVSIINLMG